MPEAVAPLPAVIAEIAEVAGMDAAWALVRAKGGQEIYLPAAASEGHWLTMLVGLDAATKICALYRGGRSGAHILVPMASTLRRAEHIRKAVAQGGTANTLASELGIHERTVRRYRRRLRLTDPDQDDLFST